MTPRCEIPLRDAVFRVIDTEGTDREPTRSRVCEVAWRDVDFQGRGRGMWFECLIDPGVPIPPSASAVHHLTDADVAGKPRLADIEHITALPGPGAYVAHGASYDRTVLGLQDWPWICTHRLAKHLWPEVENHSNQEIRYTLRLAVDLPKDTPHHRAGADVAVTAAILVAGLPLALERWPSIVTVQDLIDRIEAPALLLKIPFKTSGGQLFEHATTDHLEWIVRTGAGGEDCVFTAQHWLQQRFGDASDSFRFPFDEEE